MVWKRLDNPVPMVKTRTRRVVTSRVHLVRAMIGDGVPQLRPLRGRSPNRVSRRRARQLGDIAMRRAMRRIVCFGCAGIAFLTSKLLGWQLRAGVLGTVAHSHAP